MIKKKLSINICYHNEPQDNLENLLTSINNQINVDTNDFEILISNDSECPIYPNVIDNYKNLNIIYLVSKLKNNIGFNRQNLIDNSYSDWIMFCDNDDVLYSPKTISRNKKLRKLINYEISNMCRCKLSFN